MFVAPASVQVLQVSEFRAQALNPKPQTLNPKPSHPTFAPANQPLQAFEENLLST